MDRPLRFFHWRTHAAAEGGLERGRALVPVEVQHGTRVRGRDLRGLNSFLDAHPTRSRVGVVLYRGDEPLRFSERIALRTVARVVGMLASPPAGVHNLATVRRNRTESWRIGFRTCRPRSTFRAAPIVPNGTPRGCTRSSHQDTVRRAMGTGS